MRGEKQEEQEQRKASRVLQQGMPLSRDSSAQRRWEPFEGVAACSPESLSKLNRGRGFALVVFSAAAERRDGGGEQGPKEPEGPRS